MKKIIIIATIAVFAFLGVIVSANSTDSNIAVKTKIDNGEYSKKNYPIKVHHGKLRFECADCHGDGAKESYTELTTKDCLECHKDYKTLAERTEYLGYDDNIHASPHYPKMDCNLCHSSHKESQNYCVMCHSQDSMKKLLVP
ncbi:cytochrome c3 family protein [Malaciobacter halophilus]|uniref:cytochrome c3 family protein n=1 Tax=Malaciobacter canalis TaxID=1912871 RepID=UPI0010105700|nr:cytochrome c3 family protein [Malaciobacter halophilus]RYA23505.1 cytochrome c3 [Malaciobacter halophilus]